MTGLAVLGAQYRLGPGDRELLQRHYLPWALRAGSRCADLLCIYYERHFQVGRGVEGMWRGACVDGGGGGGGGGACGWGWGVWMGVGRVHGRGGVAQ